ncbi:MAG: NAD(P)H-dependent oxidoreductase subunit E [Acidobacteriota bacterium]
MTAFAFNPDELRAIQEIVGRYPDRQAALLPVLRMAQDRSRWLSDDVMEAVGNALDLPPAHVAGVASFYTLFYKRPVGKYVLGICRNLSCALLGAEELIEHAKKRLSLGEADTSADGKFTLETAECLAACDGAPCLQVNDAYHLNVTPERFDDIVAKLP